MPLISQVLNVIWAMLISSHRISLQQAHALVWLIRPFFSVVTSKLIIKAECKTYMIGPLNVNTSTNVINSQNASNALLESTSQHRAQHGVLALVHVCGTRT